VMAKKQGLTDFLASAQRVFDGEQADPFGIRWAPSAEVKARRAQEAREAVPEEHVPYLGPYRS
jgi:hypothetical protein